MISILMFCVEWVCRTEVGFDLLVRPLYLDMGSRNSSFEGWSLVCEIK